MISDLLRNDLEMRHRPLRRRGERHHTRSYLQRRAVKVSYSRNTKSVSWAAHGRYLAREGAQQKGAKGLGFDAGRDDINLTQTAKMWQESGDLLMFRIIVSPENGTEIDLRDHARTLMAQMECDLGTRLEWAAIDHHNTDNPHRSEEHTSELQSRFD